MDDKLTVKLEVITPEIAESILETSEKYFNTLDGFKQRPIRKATIDNYAKDMVEGRWRTNGETIKLDKEGRLMDGQHRLYAVIKSGVPIEFLMVRGIDNKDMDSIDIGLKRSLESTLQFQSECYENQAASIVKAKMQLDKQNKNLGQSNGNAHISQTEMVEEYKNNQTKYNEVAKYAKSVYKDSGKALKVTEVGAIYLHLTDTLGFDKNIVETFFLNLCSIRRNEKSIYKITVDKLEKLKMGQDKINEYMSCWNAMIKGNTLKRPTIEEHSWFMTPKRA